MMRKLIVFAVILAVVSIYFIVNAEKFIRIESGETEESKPKTNEVTPAGTDLPKLILNKAMENIPAFSSKIADLDAGEILPTAESLKNKARDLTAQAAVKIGEIIKKPIEERLNDAFCSPEQ